MFMECLTGKLVGRVSAQGQACWLSVYHPTGKHVGEGFMNPLASTFIECLPACSHVGSLH